MLTAFTALCGLCAQAANPGGVNGGGVDYSQGADALEECFNGITTMILYCIYLINSIGAIIGIYGGLQIFLKMNTGHAHDITRDILFLIGGAIFLIAGMVILPGIFGYDFRTY